MDRRLVGERTEFGSSAVQKIAIHRFIKDSSSEQQKTRSPERIERSMRRRLTKGFVAQGKQRSDGQ